MLKITAIAALVALIVGGGAGWKVRDAFCDSAKAKHEVAELKLQLKARDEAADEDRKRVEADDEELRKLKERADALESKIGSGGCLSADDVDGLRGLFR